MKTIKRLMSVVVIFFIMGMFANKPAHAIGSDIFFAINGTIQRQGPSPLNIAGTYTVGGETITIAPFGATPVVEFSETDDLLRLKNARITSSTAPINNVKFSFWRTFDTLRTGTVTYVIQGQGAFIRSTAPNPDDWIVARGYVEGTVLGSGPPENLPPIPSNPPANQKLTCTATEAPASWVFDTASPNGGFKVSHSFASLAAGANDLKAEFWIYIHKTTDRLDITKLLVKFGPPE